jgi:hypothetical protein
MTLLVTDPGIDVQANVRLIGCDSAPLACLSPNVLDPKFASLGNGTTLAVRHMGALLKLDIGAMAESDGGLPAGKLLPSGQEATRQGIRGRVWDYPR